MNTQQQADVDLAMAVIGAVGPALGPNGMLASEIVTAGAQAIKNASSAGADVSDADLQALFDQFAANDAADQQAQADRIKQDSADASAQAGVVQQGPKP